MIDHELSKMYSYKNELWSRAGRLCRSELGPMMTLVPDENRYEYDGLIEAADEMEAMINERRNGRN